MHPTRANDWLWGRLDGVEYLVAAVLDVNHLATAAEHGDFAHLQNDLSDIAFPAEHHEALSDAWQRTLTHAAKRTDVPSNARSSVTEILNRIPSGARPEQQFCVLLAEARNVDHERQVRAILLDCCRAAISARVQIEILREELPQVVKAIDEDLRAGASRASSGADWVGGGAGDSSWERVQRFRSLRIGRDELPQDEASSKLGMDIASTGVAVAAAAFSGSGGGIPAAVRAPLASVRGLALVFNMIVRLLVRTPVLGIATMIAAATALVWGLLAPNTVLAAALPALAAIVVGGAAVLIAIATSPLEARCRSFWQGLGLLLIALLPALLIALVIGLPFGLRDTWDGIGNIDAWLASRIGQTPLDLAAVFMVAALAAALARLAAGWSSHKFRAADLWVYRWCLLLAGAVIGIGATIEHLRGEADRLRGAILFLILFGVISLSPLTGEIAAGLRWLCTWRYDKRTRRCPDCAERIRLAARVCKHCGFSLGPEARTPAAEA